VAAVGFNALSVFMALFLPETLPISISEHPSDNSDSSSIVSDSSERSEEPVKGKTLLSRVRKSKELFGFVTNNAAVAALVLTFLISKVGRQATNILFQYASIKYHWSLSQVSGKQVPYSSHLVLIQYTYHIGWTTIVFTRGSQHLSLRSNPSSRCQIRPYED
jgi:hypothetical protein